METRKRIIYKNLSFLGFPKHRVGDNGSVWGKGRWENNWSELKSFPHRDGHLSVDLIYKNTKRRFQVHRLVLFAFVGPCPDGMEACHFPDRSPANNQLTNLRWDTRSNNAKDSVKHKTSHLLGQKYTTGENNYNAKLCGDSVREIRGLWKTGEYGKRELGRKFGVSHGVILSILNGTSWQHIK